MGDIDFLIQNKFTAKVTQTLYSLAYVQDENNPDEFYLTHQHLKPFYHLKNKTCIEVHTRLFSQKRSKAKERYFNHRISLKTYHRLSLALIMYMD